MVNPDRIRTKLIHLDESIAILREAQKYSYEDLLKSPLLYGGVERYLQVCIEILSDVGNHIISTENLGEVHWNQDIATLFYEKEFIDLKLKEIWVQMIKFRNLIVHEYTVIDKKEVYRILQNHLDDFILIQKKIVEKFL